MGWELGTTSEFPQVNKPFPGQGVPARLTRYGKKYGLDAEHKESVQEMLGWNEGTRQYSAHDPQASVDLILGHVRLHPGDFLVED